MCKMYRMRFENVGSQTSPKRVKMLERAIPYAFQSPSPCLLVFTSSHSPRGPKIQTSRPHACRVDSLAPETEQISKECLLHPFIIVWRAHLRNALNATLIFAQYEAGTAVCVSPEGWVLTCSHCFDDDEEEYEAAEKRRWLPSLPHWCGSPS